MRINRTFTVGVNPICVSTETGASDGIRLIADRVFIQMLPVAGGGGLGYVMDGIRPDRVPSIALAGDVTAVLASATATDPGGGYSDSDAHGGIDLSLLWIHGAQVGDTIKFSAKLRI